MRIRLAALILAAAGGLSPAAAIEPPAESYLLPEPKALVAFSRALRAVTAAAISPDGGRVLFGDIDGDVLVADASSSRILSRLAGHGYGHKINSASFRPDGRWVVTASDDNTAIIWDTGLGRLHARLLGHEELVKSAAFSPDGNRVVTASLDRTIRVWDADSGRLLRTFARQKCAVLSAAFGPSGGDIVSINQDGTRILWDASNGRKLETATLGGERQWLQYAAVSSDGKHILTVGDAPTLWESRSGRKIAAFAGSGDWLLSAAVSPDGTQVATACFGPCPAALWDARTGRKLMLLAAETQTWAVAFSPEGGRVVTAGNGDPPRLWRLRYGPDEIKERERALSIPAVPIEPGSGLPTAEDAFRIPQFDGPKRKTP